MATDAEIGKRVAALRRALGKSQEQLATETEVGRSYLAEVETGVKSPSFSFVVAICEGTQANSDWLLFGRGEMFRGVSTSLAEQPASYGATEPVPSDRTFNARFFAALRLIDEVTAERKLNLPQDKRRGLIVIAHRLAQLAGGATRDDIDTLVELAA